MKVKHVVVRADWMKACGYGEAEETMEVTYTYPRTLPDGTRMFDVIRANGRHWTVAEWRCSKVIEEKEKRCTCADEDHCDVHPMDTPSLDPNGPWGEP